jgi:hypothetical protein
MAASSTVIANLALSHLGVSKEITNLDSEASAEAAACRRFYEPSRLQTLRDFNWPFATKYAVAGLVATNPTEIDQEWGYSYRYPSDCVKLRRIVSGIRPETRQVRVPYQIARDTTGLLIYTNQPNAEVEYTFNEQDVSRFPEDFAMAQSLRMALYMAPRLTAGDPFKLRAGAAQLYAFEVDRARASAGNEEQANEEPPSELERSRGGADIFFDPRFPI